MKERNQRFLEIATDQGFLNWKLKADGFVAFMLRPRDTWVLNNLKIDSNICEYGKRAD